jgi:ethanolamine ammonia-lyase small subunit
MSKAGAAKPPVTPDAWVALRRLTQARIALGRAGVSQPTGPHMAFQRDHALARDAVHAALDVTALRSDLHDAGFATIETKSAAPDRATFLQRPDLGRSLSPTSRDALSNSAAKAADVVMIVADGLSAYAAQAHAAPLLARLAPDLCAGGLTIAPVVVVEQGRVAISDEIGEALGARLALILLGERPGLSAADSLGAYLTFAPRSGRTDAERNCVSNIRLGGLDYAAASGRLYFLITEALARGLSGVQLKDETCGADPLAQSRSAGANFLLAP